MYLSVYGYIYCVYTINKEADITSIEKSVFLLLLMDV